MIAYHGSEHSEDFEEILKCAVDTDGIHLGTKKAAVMAVMKYDDDCNNMDDEYAELILANSNCFFKIELSPQKIYEGTDTDANSHEKITALKTQGYDCLAYPNEFEDIGSISYLVMDIGCIKAWKQA